MISGPVLKEMLPTVSPPILQGIPYTYPHMSPIPFPHIRVPLVPTLYVDIWEVHVHLPVLPRRHTERNARSAAATYLGLEENSGSLSQRQLHWWCCTLL